MATENLVTICSVNGLLSGGTKPLSEPMSTYDYGGSVAFTQEQLGAQHTTCIMYNKFEYYIFTLSMWPVT